VNIKSYGHDIEASWLIDRAAQVLQDKDIMGLTQSYTQAIAENILKVAYTPYGVMNETVNHVMDKSRIWWVQAESVIGFTNAYGKTGDQRFRNAAINTFDYIQKNVVDKASGEWFWKIDEQGQPVSGFPFVSPWKCPYHNSRMYIELIERKQLYV
jgi:mannobiose 2-epimerase